MRSGRWGGTLPIVKLTEWLDEYRQLTIDAAERPAGEPADDWAEQELLAPADRVRDRTPRWLARAERVGHARATQV